MYLEMVKVCFWLDEWCDTVLKELFPDSFLIVDEKDVFVHSCLDFSEDGRVHSQNLRFVVTFNMNPSSNSMKLQTYISLSFIYPQNNEIVITKTWYKYLPIEDRTKYLLISQNQNLPMITKIIRITGKSKGMETDSSYYLSLPFHVYKAQT
jgi:hypothetical protein